MPIRGTDVNTFDLRYLKLDQTTPQTTVGTFTFPNIAVTNNVTCNRIYLGGSTDTYFVLLGNILELYVAGQFRESWQPDNAVIVDGNSIGLLLSLTYEVA